MLASQLRYKSKAPQSISCVFMPIKGVSGLINSGHASYSVLTTSSGDLVSFPCLTEKSVNVLGKWKGQATSISSNGIQLIVYDINSPEKLSHKELLQGFLDSSFSNSPPHPLKLDSTNEDPDDPGTFALKWIPVIIS